MAARRPPLILLPPSEGKWAPARGKRIDLPSLSFPSLTPLRDGLLDDELRHAPTTTAARLYTGVLYASLDIATLPRGAARNIVIISATYVAAWRPSRESGATRVQLAVVEEIDGVRRVVSHMAKKTRGEVARHLLVSGARPRTPAELADAVGARFSCELEPPERPGAPFVLTVVQR